MLVCNGNLKGAFKGFRNRETAFHFVNGQIWEQDEYYYEYCYSYMPKAKVTQENGGYFLTVEGVNKKIKVRKIR